MDNEKRLLIEVSDYYYHEGKTQQQIANELGLSRMKISRLLQKAKDKGIVKISIDYGGVYLEVEKQLKRNYSLDKVIVVPNIENNLKRELANAAAFYLNNTLHKEDLVAVGWGTTIHEIIQYCEGDFKKQISFSPIIGGHGKSQLNLHATTICSDLAAALNGEAYSLLAPAFVNSKKDKTALMKDTFINEVISRTKQANKALFSLGSPSFDRSTIHKAGYFSEDELKRIKASGTVCDLVSIAFLNEKGETILEEITDRSIGIDWKDLKSIPEKVCVVGGFEKHKTTKIAIEAGFVDVLITDIDTAEFLLQG
ncbi:DNA-binding transcriptional regulator [Enterococcus florum]|uniref:DNA-binding transcriptional regulator n=1 Tax=Enterococcus florum TaxID=2480627 RepID=A0A4P5P5K0_9ENTE|nr:sugar-binding transcriptional regulator [Enterococcus florum]GCF93115.1 DNA-binding transcriptional regulator [Enterococcus florum]